MKRKAISNMPGNRVIPKKTSHCYHCFTIFQAGNHQIRLKPRRKISHSVHKLLAKSKGSSKQLGTFQKRMVDLYLQSRNKLVISCFTCKKTVKMACQSHEERIQQLFKPAPKEIDEKVMTKNQKKRKKRKTLRQKKKFTKFLFDNEEEALAAAKKKNNIPEEDSEQAPVPGPEMPVLTVPETQTRKTTEPILHKSLNVTQPSFSVKTLHNASRTSGVSQNSVSKKKTAAVGVVKSKKKKGRDLHQQLQKVLAADKEKKSGNSLQDFLTSL
ncbi:uncharacterized protein LOC121388531 isoform X2 [Gigantopelta aegis]|nr:uncharacterized protein LOC121388531 isoform X2 [Gigantopelta aegis]